MSMRLKPLTMILAIVGLVLLAVALIYLIVPANSLPGIMGPATHSHLHRTRRGIAALALAVLVGAAAVASYVLGGDEV